MSGSLPAVRSSIERFTNGRTHEQDPVSSAGGFRSQRGDSESIAVLEVLSKDVNPDIGKEALRAIQTIRARGGQ